MKLPAMDEKAARAMIDAGFLSLEGVSEAAPEDLAPAGFNAAQAGVIIDYAKSRLQ